MKRVGRSVCEGWEFYWEVVWCFWLIADRCLIFMLMPDADPSHRCSSVLPASPPSLLASSSSSNVNVQRPTSTSTSNHFYRPLSKLKCSSSLPCTNQYMSLLRLSRCHCLPACLPVWMLILVPNSTRVFIALGFWRAG